MTHQDHQKQAARIRASDGFVVALDQSGGSTPKALGLYGIEESAWSSDEEMFGLIHQMRARIVQSPSFTGDKIVGAILFEKTMDSDIGGKPTGDFLWADKGIVPFLKVDRGLAAEADGGRLMQPMPDLDKLLKKAVSRNMFGTKMRSVVNAASPTGIATNVAQQFEIGKRILGHGLIPIIEPEVTISIADKAEAEDILRDELGNRLDQLGDGVEVMLKLTLPEVANHYKPLVDHKGVMKVVALSGGYSRDEANARLARNRGMIASFSRALGEGLSAQQSEAAFDAALAASVDSIYAASVAG